MPDFPNFPAHKTNSQISHHLTARWLNFCPCQHWAKLCSLRTNKYKVTCMGVNYSNRLVGSRKSNKTVKTLTGQVHNWALWDWLRSEHDHGHKTSYLRGLLFKVDLRIHQSPKKCQCQWIPHLSSLQYQLRIVSSGWIVQLIQCWTKLYIELVSTMIDNNESDTDSQNFGHSWSELFSFHILVNCSDQNPSWASVSSNPCAKRYLHWSRDLLKVFSAEMKPVMHWAPCFGMFRVQHEGLMHSRNTKKYKS